VKGNSGMESGMRIRLQELLQEKAQREGRQTITQEEVVAATGISRPTVSDWLRDRVDRLDRRTIVKFCDYLECSIGDLLVLER
jgi:DNA-binding Xre family transcriptional regulator